jgi:sodium transport system permease protein
MNVRGILTVYGKELKDSLRDRRTLLSMIVIPLFVMPALVYAVGRIGARAYASARGEMPTVMVLGGADSPRTVAALRHSPRFTIVPEAADYRQLISDRKIRAAVQIPPGFDAGLQAGAAGAVVIFHYQGELKSGFAVGELEAFFRDLRERAVAAALAAHGLPASLVTPFAVQRENVAPPEKVGGNAIGGLVPYLIIMLCFTGALYPAIDLTAGEKERGTMETLLCSPVARVDIVLGKFSMVLTSSLCAMALSLVSMAATLMLVGTAAGRGGPFDGGGGALPLLNPLGVVGVLVMVFPVAVLFSALLLTIALYAKSSKEAQTYLTPLAFVVLLPVVVGLLPGIELNAGLSLIPILNLSLVCKEMLSGIWHWNYLALIFGSTCAYAGLALALAVRMFNREDVLFRT